MTPARWVDLGEVSPVRLHAACQGVAEAQTAADPPIVLWAKTDRAHISLGASQSASAEIDRRACGEAQVPIYRRPLGGGTVLVDPDQWCFFVIVPRAHSPPGRDDFFSQCLAPMVAAMRHHGLTAERMGRGDIWAGRRKILGSGAATLGQASVLGASVLIAFPAALFARVARCPSEAFRHWLFEAMMLGMTGWRELAEPPEESMLAATFRHCLEERTGWAFRESGLTSAEETAVDEARAEVLDVADAGTGGRLLPGGMKINQDLYLVERALPEGELRVLYDGPVIRWLWVSALSDEVLPAVEDCPVTEDDLTRSLSERTTKVKARFWATRIVELYAGVRRLRDA